MPEPWGHVGLRAVESRLRFPTGATIKAICQCLRQPNNFEFSRR